MAKYNCKKCGNVWDDKGFPTTCPKCGSNEIKTAKSSKSVIIYSLIGVLLVVLFFVMLKNSGGGDIEMSLSSNEMKDVEIKIVNLSKSDYRDYRFVVYKDAEKYDDIAISSDVVRYSNANMLSGECYTFRFVAKEGETPVHTWLTSNQYCVPIPPAEEPELCASLKSKADCNTNSYSVTVAVDNADKFESLTYYLDNEEQSSPIFANVQAGDYTIVVRSEQGQEIQLPLSLQKIESKELSKQDVQKIFDSVAAGSMSAGKAQTQLSNGSVKLQSSVGENKTLQDILVDMEGFGTEYVVIDFKYDECTGKITSGTLKVRQK